MKRLVTDGQVVGNGRRGAGGEVFLSPNTQVSYGLTNVRGAPITGADVLIHDTRAQGQRRLEGGAALG